MDQISIPAEVVNGHLRHDRPLSQWEGQSVIATLTLVPKTPPPEPESKPEPPAPITGAEFDPEPPEWLQVEQDVYFPMTVPEILLEKKPLIVERGKPSAFIPEELPAWLDVEQDVYVPMTVPAVSLGKVTLKIERGTPSIILPEELPDD